jgi:sugar lactone lactonase YvrE
MGDASVEVVLSDRSMHAEGPRWDAVSARLWWVDITGRRVHRLDPVTGNHASWVTPGEPGGVALTTTGRPVVASPAGLGIVDLETARFDLRVPLEQDRPENRANDVTVDGRGRVWVGTMAYDKRPGNGALYRVDAAGVVPMVHGLTISNGPAIDERDGRLYLADTARYTVDVFDLDPAAGTLTNRRRFVDLSAQAVWPDGMTLDDDGMVWIALGLAGAVHRYRPDGTLDGVVEVTTANPTAVAFGGADGGDLFVTTSWTDAAEDQRQKFDAGTVLHCRPGVSGPPAPRCTALDP